MMILPKPDRLQTTTMDAPSNFGTRCYEYGCPLYPPDVAAFFHENDPTEKELPAPFSMATYQSNQHHFNQDAAVLVSPFGDSSLPKNMMLLGLFDGHGDDGHVVAQTAAKLLPLILADKLRNIYYGGKRDDDIDESSIRNILTDTFVQINESLPPFQALRGGCTASVTLQIGHKLYIANVGDSQTVVAQMQQQQEQNNPTSTIVYKTRKDKPHLPEERARIEQAGGRVQVPEHFANGSRVIVHSSAAQPPEAIGIAMSRSLGDWEWKEAGVIAEPIVDVVDLTRYDSKQNVFVLAASDGVWDMRKPEFIAKHFFDNAMVTSTTARDVIYKVAPAKPQWYRDDMTLVYVAVTPP